MGTDFFGFYDVIIVAMTFLVIFACFKKGFVTSLLSLVALVVSFFLALFLSSFISNAIYVNLVEKKLDTEINNYVSEVLDNNILVDIGGIDMDKMKINGKLLAEIKTDPDSAGNVTIDLSSMDYSETGMKDVDLSAFGIDSETTDYTKMKAGTVQFSQNQLENDKIGTLILAHTLAANTKSGTLYGAISGIAESLNNVLPNVMGKYSNSVIDGEKDAVAQLILNMINTSSNSIGTTILDSMVKPAVLVPIRIIVFALIFMIISVILKIIVSATRAVNKIPVIGGINSVLGGALGIAEAVLICFIICLGVQFVISITGNSIIFLNTMTIEKTYIFKYFYNFNLLNFLG